MIVWGYILMKDTYWLPRMLGGNLPGAVPKDVCENYVFRETPPGLEFYIYVTYGYHLHNFIEHLFFKER